MITGQIAIYRLNVHYASFMFKERPMQIGGMYTRFQSVWKFAGRWLENGWKLTDFQSSTLQIGSQKTDFQNHTPAPANSDTKRHEKMGAGDGL